MTVYVDDARMPARVGRINARTDSVRAEAFRRGAVPIDEDRCPHVSASQWGPARCVLPEGHFGRHAYGPPEGESS